MPLGSGSCLHCIDNERAFKVILIFDLISFVLIVTLPRAIGAAMQLHAGSNKATIYSKLRVANWYLIFAVAVVALCVYLKAEILNNNITELEIKVGQILTVCASTFLGLLLDFHFC